MPTETEPVVAAKAFLKTIPADPSHRIGPAGFVPGQSSTAGLDPVTRAKVKEALQVIDQAANPRKR